MSGSTGVNPVDAMERIRRATQNGVSLAQNVRGADLAITDTDRENGEEYQEGLDDENNDGYLPALDTEGDGRAIVANGDPDTADNATALVPGTTTTWESINGQVGRGDSLMTAAEDADPSGITPSSAGSDTTPPMSPKRPSKDGPRTRSMS